MGDGILKISKTKFCENATFKTYRLNSEATKYDTEYVVGYGCLHFDKSSLDTVGFDPSILKYPEWTCDKYEEWLHG